MDKKGLFIAFYTLVRRDTSRIIRIWSQTLLPAAITSALYFLIFGTLLGNRIGEIGGYSYIAFVVPGLIMLQVITNAYSNSATVMFTSKFFSRNIDEILVSPTPPWVIVAGIVSGGIMRGFLVGVIVLLVSLFFTHLHIFNIAVLLGFFVITSLVASLGGLVNGIYAKSIDAISFVPTFVLTPLVYLGGVFYSVQALPEIWLKLTYLNPIFYVINGFRYGFLGLSDVSLFVASGVLLVLVLALSLVAVYLIRTGLGLKQ